MKRHFHCPDGRSVRRVVAALAVPGLAAAGLVLAGTAAAAPAAPPRSAHAAHGRGPGWVVLSGSPGMPAFNRQTDTLYVPIQCVADHCSPATPAHEVDIVNAASCNAKTHAGCHVVARVRVGAGPLEAIPDNRTGTVYVVNSNSNTVSVLDGDRCNAAVRSHCRPVATVRVGKFPVAAALNPATRTLYVANLMGASISVIDAARCNARITRGCGGPARVIHDRAGPAWVAVNGATDTVYAANNGTAGNGGNTVSVIDGAQCNGHAGSGCGRVPVSVRVGHSPGALAVDRASDTIYVPNSGNGFDNGSVSVINGAQCNARVTAGCRSSVPVVPTGIAASQVAVAPSLHTAFTVNHADHTISVIDTRACSGRVQSGCRTRPRSLQIGPDQGPGFDWFSSVVALAPRTGTAYSANEGGSNILNVLDISRCNAGRASGCRAEAPSVPSREFLMSVDPASNTIYAGNLDKPRIDVFSGATCRQGHLSGCTPVAAIPMSHPQANVGAIDQATHTLYATDPFAGTVSVINTAACNATHTSGCAAHPPSVAIGRFPNAPVVNTATKTLYVSFGPVGNRVAVVNIAACNAISTAGCGQTPAVVKVGKGSSSLAVSSATDTVYVSDTGFDFAGDTVSVINGATCNGTDHGGCGSLARVVKVGPGPTGITVNDLTHTVYVAINAHGFAPGTVEVINGSTCNGAVTTGCSGHFPVMPTGPGPLLLAMDAHAGLLYVTDFTGASVSVLSTARCHAAVSRGCAQARRDQPVGSGPQDIVVNPRTRTVYAINIYQPGFMSVFADRRP